MRLATIQWLYGRAVLMPIVLFLTKQTVSIWKVICRLVIFLVDNVIRSWIIKNKLWPKVGQYQTGKWLFLLLSAVWHTNEAKGSSIVLCAAQFSSFVYFCKQGDISSQTHAVSKIYLGMLRPITRLQHLRFHSLNVTNKLFWLSLRPLPPFQTPWNMTTQSRRLFAGCQNITLNKKWKMGAKEDQERGGE